MVVIMADAKKGGAKGGAKKARGGLAKPVKPSAELAKIVGSEPMPRSEVTKRVWDYIKKHKFFAMIIPKKYGGLEFSAYANAMVIAKLASRSTVASSTVGVPNSLGPAELLLHYGTEEQKQRYLPGLASATEIPCFALTSPQAGSDAAALIDSGVVCKGEWQGEETIGIRLTWEKRYITLAPVATVLGLAFKLYDPEHLIGDRDAYGITAALIGLVAQLAPLFLEVLDRGPGIRAGDRSSGGL